MANNPKVNEGQLIALTSQTGAIDGAWMTVPDAEKRTHIPVVYSLASGTATWTLEGRNNEGDTPVEVDADVSASGAELVVCFKQFRVTVSAASGATLTVSLGTSRLIEG